MFTSFNQLSAKLQSLQKFTVTVTARNKLMYLKFEMCSSRKYPYPHHGGNFVWDPPPPRIFRFLKEVMTPPPLWIFHKTTNTPPTPLEKFVREGKVLKMEQMIETE